ncbi:MAG: hypothetical protein WAO55_04570 [Candidatus Manganitrophaceae bacterium]
MSHILPVPRITFRTKEETIAAIQKPDWMASGDSFQAKSVWLCEELNDYEKTIGFPYNSTFQRWIEKKEGIGPFNENSSPLSCLIYNAQRYRESDRLIAEGWFAPTAETIEKAIQSNQMVEVWIEGFLASSAHLCKIRKGSNNMHYAIPKGRRTRGYVLHNQPIRFPK